MADEKVEVSLSEILAEIRNVKYDIGSLVGVVEGIRSDVDRIKATRSRGGSEAGESHSFHSTDEKVEEEKSDVMTREDFSQDDIQMQAETPGGHHPPVFRDRRRTSTLLPLPFPERGTAVAESSVQKTLIVSSSKIKEKLKYLSLRAVLWLFREAYPSFVAENIDPTKHLVHLIEQPILQDLVDHQRDRRTILSRDLTIATVYKLSDEAVLQMLSDKLRPKTKSEYATLLLDNMTKMKAPSDRSGFRFDRLQFYDELIHPQVCKKLEELESIVNFFDMGASADEQSHFPKMKLGTREDWGMFRLFLASFGTYNANFVNLLGSDKLKSFTSMKEFVTYFRDVSAARAREAEKLRYQDQAYDIAQTLDDIESKLQVKQAKMERQSRRMSEEKQRNDAADKAATTAYAVQQLASLNQIALGGLNALQSPSVPTVTDMATSLTEEQLSVPDDNLGDVFHMSISRAFPLNAGKPSPETQACFRKAFSSDGKCTVVGCKYSHNEDAIRKLVASRYQEAVRSRFFTPTPGPTLRKLVGVSESSGSDSEASRDA